jgi:hypothetical protein
VQFEKVLNEPERGINLDMMFVDSLLEKALSEDQDQWKRIGTSGPFADFYSNFEHSNIGYGFYCFKNNSSKNIKVTLILTTESNISICKFNLFQNLSMY